MLKYRGEIYSGKIIYSCDMLRLAFRVPRYLSFMLLQHLPQNVFCLKHMIDVEHFFSSRTGKYKDLFVYKISDDEVFTVGFPFNDFKNESSLHGFIEFNPNKINSFIIKRFLDLISIYAFNSHGRIFTVKSYDIAIDIPTARDNVVLVKNSKKRHTRITSGSVTEYSGARGSHCACKLYDKAAEAKLDYPLTRLEITFTKYDDVELPEVYIFDDVDSETDMEDLNATDKVIVRLLRQLDHDEQQKHFRALGRCKRQKLESYIYPVDNLFKYDRQAIMFVQGFIQSYEYNNNADNMQLDWEHKTLIEKCNQEAMQMTAYALEPFPEYYYAPSYDR